MIKTIGQLNGRQDLILLTDSQDVEELREQFTGYDSFFVLAEEGDYSEIWGFVGSIPWNSKLVSKLFPWEVSK